MKGIRTWLPLQMRWSSIQRNQLMNIMSTCLKTNLFVGVTVVTATFDHIEILVTIPLIFSLSNYAGDLHRVVIESLLHLSQPLLRSLPLNQCLRPQFYELTQLLVWLWLVRFINAKGFRHTKGCKWEWWPSQCIVVLVAGWEVSLWTSLVVWRWHPWEKRCGEDFTVITRGIANVVGQTTKVSVDILEDE